MRVQGWILGMRVEGLTELQVDVVEVAHPVRVLLNICRRNVLLLKYGPIV